MNYAALICWALIAWSLAARPGTVMILLLGSMPFASLALVPPDALFGMSILPQSVFAVILIAKVLVPEAISPSPKLLIAFWPQYLGFLALFLLVGAIATVLMPRLFLGDVVVVPMREVSGAELLKPTPSNFSQFGYVALSVLVTFVTMLMVQKPGFARTLLTGVLAGGIVCIVTGLIDFAAASVGMDYLLDPFRNAGYAYLTNAEISGVRRVVGFTPEASTYGGLCVQFSAALALLRHLYAEGRQRSIATIAYASLILMALLSTSSTAYGGLAILGVAYAANSVRRAISPSPLGQSGLLGELLCGFALVVALVLILVVDADLFDPFLRLVDEVIFQKPLTSSYYGRSEWNAIAWNTVSSTWGLGVGLGSTRASNWLVAVVSNTGLIGAGLMGMFLVQTFARSLSWRTPVLEEFLSALKLSLLPPLGMAVVAAPGPDFGPWIGVVFGTVAGIAAYRPKRSPGRHTHSEASRPARVTDHRATSSPASRRLGSGPDKPAPRPLF
jgi:hypothetical protein